MLVMDRVRASLMIDVQSIGLLAALVRVVFGVVAFVEGLDGDFAKQEETGLTAQPGVMSVRNGE